MELLPLVCLCLLSWSGRTSADHHERVVVKQDDDAVLNCSFNGVNIETWVFDWKRDKDQKEVFLYAAGSHYNSGRPGQDEQFKGRVSHFQDELKHGNASIKIKKTKMADKGNYTCKFPNNHPSPTFHIELVVGAAPKPSVKTLLQTETSAQLQCEAHGVPDLEVHWQDSDGNKLLAEEPQVTKREGLVYITLNATVTKTDRFFCVATQKNLGHRISTETHVYLHGAAPEPSVKILHQTRDQAQLQCKAHGVPDLEVHWQDSAGNLLPAEKPQVTERGGLFYITLLTTVTKTDHFHCVAKQKSIGHTVSSDTYVYIDRSSSGSDSVSPLGGLLLLQFLLLFFLF